jgi:hypothetical protein
MQRVRPEEEMVYPVTRFVSLTIEKFGIKFYYPKWKHGFSSNRFYRM